MPFNGAGTYAPPGADFPVVTLTTVSSVHFNNTVTDMSTGISNCLTKDGQTTWTANQPAGGFKITNMAAGAVRSDSARMGDVQDAVPLWGGTAGGTGDALTITLTPAITAYTTPQLIWLKTSAANTGAATIAVNGLAAKTIQRNGAALAAGDLASGKWYALLYDGVNFQLMGSSDGSNPHSVETLTNKTLTSPTLTNPTITSQKVTTQTLTAGASIAWDMSLGTSAVLTLAAAANAIANPTNLATGQWGWLTLKQDGTGNRTIASWGNAYKFVGGVAPIGAATGLSTAASAVDRAYWICDDGVTVQLTFGKGFA